MIEIVFLCVLVIGVIVLLAFAAWGRLTDDEEAPW